jgi:predicted GNAT superfamily acetyltransferase
MYATGRLGGLALGASDSTRYLGGLYAFPAAGSSLYLALLCVVPSARNRGVATALLKELGRSALAKGCTSITWTTDSLSSRNLYLYLRQPGVYIVDHHPEMNHGLMVCADDESRDEVEFLWTLTSPHDEAVLRPCTDNSDPGFPLLSRTVPSSNGTRRWRGWSLGGVGDCCGVEIPWDQERLSAALRHEWRVGLRDAVAALLEHGLVGSEYVFDPPGQRSYLLFERAPKRLGQDLARGHVPPIPAS